MVPSCKVVRDLPDHRCYSFKQAVMRNALVWGPRVGSVKQPLDPASLSAAACHDQLAPNATKPMFLQTKSQLQFCEEDARASAVV